jgi:hypothetical protein
MGKSQRYLIWLALFVVLIVFASAAAAANPPETIVRHVIAAGGQRVAAGPFILRGTLGEAVAGPGVSAGAYQNSSGYWRELSLPTQLYLPMLRR